MLFSLLYRFIFGLQLCGVEASTDLPCCLIGFVGLKTDSRFFGPLNFRREELFIFPFFPRPVFPELAGTALVLPNSIDSVDPV